VTGAGAGAGAAARRTALAAAAVAAVAVPAGGCGASQERVDGATVAAWSFARAVETGDGAAMCAVLARGTKRELEWSERAACARAVVGRRLPTPGTVRRTDVHGRRAMVELEGDTLFLAETSAGWKVTAAGCAPRPGQPYRCRVRGG
jgi:hypothetical protein